jgi:hypothetical protein
LALLAERFFPLSIHELVGLLRLLFGFGVHPQMSIHATQLVVRGRELRIHLDDTLKCLARSRPVLL